MAEGYSDKYGTYNEEGNPIDYYKGMEPTRNVAEPRGVIPPEVGPDTNFIEQLMNMLQQGMGGMNSLFSGLSSPKAHDSIDRILGENEWTVAQQQQSPEQQVAFRDSIMAQREAGFGPSFGNKDVDSLIEGLLRSQGEFGAAQPVSPYREQR